MLYEFSSSEFRMVYLGDYKNVQTLAEFIFPGWLSDCDDRHDKCQILSGQGVCMNVDLSSLYNVYKIVNDHILGYVFG